MQEVHIIKERTSKININTCLFIMVNKSELELTRFR